MLVAKIRRSRSRRIIRAKRGGELREGGGDRMFSGAGLSYVSEGMFPS